MTAFSLKFPIFQVYARRIVAPIAHKLTSLNSYVARHPLTSAIALGSTTKITIDFLVQRNEAHTSIEAWSYDKHRGLAFGLFGALYLGVCQWQIYCRLFPAICAAVCPGSVVAKSVLQVVLDQVVVFPAIYFPLFYGIQGAVRPESSLASAGITYRANIWDDCMAAWTVWAPVQLANFSIVPRHWRAPFISVTGFAWTTYLSTKRGAMSTTSDQQGLEDMAVQGLEDMPVQGLEDVPVQGLEDMGPQLAGA